MPGITPWRLGQHLTAASIQRLSVAADGTFSNNSTPLSVIAVVERLGHDVEKQFEDIRPITNTQINEVPTGFGNRISLTVLKKSTEASALHVVQDTANYVLITWTEGPETFVGYFTVGNMRGGMDGHGRQTVTVDFGPCDPGTGTPQVTRTTAV